MLQSLKKLLWAFLLVSGQQAVWAFALGGPIGTLSDSWQVPDIDYGVGGDLLAPKNIGEEYRLNSQTYYYACDASFLEFFGSDGANAIDQSFAILNRTMTNNSLGNLNGYSTALTTEFPFNSQGVNGTASGVGLLDVKSFTLHAMLEQMGLADPERYVWCLHDRWLPNGGTCPSNEMYYVIQRNFSVTNSSLNNLQYSSYVNNSLFTYSIYEFCNAPTPPQAECVNSGSAGARTSVAGANIIYGGYYTNLTLDDVAGLRYLLNTNNLNYESPTPGAVLLSTTTTGGTSYGPAYFLYSSNYTAFLQTAQTNDPVTLSNLYPGLIINSYTLYPTVVYTTNYVFAYYTNQVGSPVGSPQIPVYTPVITSTPVMNYAYNFANVIIFTNHYSSSSTATLITTNVTYGKPGSPYTGALFTNVSSQTITLSVPSGDYYINTNSCGPSLILTNVPPFPVAAATTTTNLLLVSINSSGLYQSQTLITRSTNYTYWAEPQVCGNGGGGGATATNAPGLYQGVGKILFVKASYDSLLGQYFQPITNTYSMVLVSNSKLVNQQFQRVVTVPDYTFAAADLASGPSSTPQPFDYVFSRNVNFDPGNALPGLAGPGTIVPASTLTYNKVGDIFLNGATQTNNPVTTQANQSTNFAWASFDGSTNLPIVYPNGTSIANLANQVLVQITPAILPNGTINAAYSASFSITGGAFTAPYTWTLPSGGLPPGLNLSPTGVITGTPTLSGTFGPFTLQLTDVNSRSVQWNYSLTIQ
jgi:hypothetical protein